MKHVTALAAAISACLLTGSMAMAQETGTTPQTDEATSTRTADASGMRRSKLDTAEFVKKAGAGGAAEVEIGKLAAEKATSPEVKAFAQRMVTDHTKANKELMAAAQAKNLEVPTEPGMMEKGMMEKLEYEKAGPKFDHAYMKHMVSDHKKDIELFEQASTDQNVDPEFRALAKKTLPTLQSHLRQAQEIEQSLAKNQ